MKGILHINVDLRRRIREMSKKLLRELATKHGIQNIEEYGGTIVVPDCQFDRSWTRKLESLGCRVITKSEGARYIILPKDPDTKAANTKKPEKKPKRGWAMKWTNEQDAVLTNAVDPKKKLWPQGKKILEEYNKVKKPEWPPRTVSGIRNRIYLLLKGVPDVEEPPSDVVVDEAATGKSEIETDIAVMYKVTPHLPFFAVEPENQHLAADEMTKLAKELEYLAAAIKKKLEEPVR